MKQRLRKKSSVARGQLTLTHVEVINPAHLAGRHLLGATQSK